MIARPRLALGERMAFAGGDAGYNLVWQTIELYLLFYYANVMGLSPHAAAAIFLIGALADLLGDPLVGVGVDRLARRIPARAWVALAGPPLGVALVLTFVAPAGVTGTGQVAALSLAYLALRITYSLGNIPYSVLTARITDDPGDQVRLTAIRMQGAAIGGLVAGLVYLAFPLDKMIQVAGLGAVPVGALVLAVMAQPLFLWTARGVRERVPPPAPAPGEQPGSMVAIMRHHAVWRLLALILITGTSVTAMHKGLLFVFAAMGATRWGYVMAMLPSLTLFVGAPLCTFAVERWGQARVIRVSALVNVAATALGWGASQVGLGGLMAHHGLALAVVGGILALIVALASAVISTIFWAMAPVAIAWCERDTGHASCAARIYALSTVARKLGQAVAPQLIAMGLMTRGGNPMGGLLVAALAAFGATLAFLPRPEGTDETA